MRGLTLTIITAKASSLNYGESIGNVSVLKKLSLADRSQITFVSDKALKYEIRKQGKERGWRLLDEKLRDFIKGNLKVEKHKKKDKEEEKLKLEIDFFGKELIRDYEEFDLFGGLFTNLKTEDGKKPELSYGDSVKRTSPVKLTYAFSLSKFYGDINFLNNIDAYNRYIKHVEDKAQQSIANFEEHTSHYLYTLTVDLERIGVWEKENGERQDVISNEERAKRVMTLLEIIKTLNREIRGRWESLSPIFLVGGVFNIKHPFFINGVRAVDLGDKLYLDIQRLKEAIELIPNEESDKVIIGLHSGTFQNEDEIKNGLVVHSIADAIEKLKEEVKKSYGVS